MTEIKTSERETYLPYFIIVNDRYILGTYKGIGQSETTLDVRFRDFARDLTLQEKLGLLTSQSFATSFDDPGYYQFFASFLAGHLSANIERRAIEIYLLEDNVLRLMVLERNLRQEIRGYRRQEKEVQERIRKEELTMAVAKSIQKD